MNERLKLKPEIKALWTAALRSGEYKQGTGRLRDNEDCFCCLGVLCNIHAQEHPEFAKTQTYIKTYDGQQYIPSEAVFEWAFGASYNSSMDASVFVKNSTGLGTSLAKLNDSGRYTFNKLANVIDENL